MGTATVLGHGGMAVADAANAALRSAAGRSLRSGLSDGDLRERHRGLSHHTQAVALPRASAERSLGRRCRMKSNGWRDACAGLPLDHMGRGPDDDALSLRSRPLARISVTPHRCADRVSVVPPAMKIGVAKEIKSDEYRVALTPAGARELVQRGHDVLVEHGAGAGSGFPDEAYVAVGARIAPVDEVWARPSCCSR